MSLSETVDSYVRSAKRSYEEMEPGGEDHRDPPALREHWAFRLAGRNLDYEANERAGRRTLLERRFGSQASGSQDSGSKESGSQESGSQDSGAQESNTSPSRSVPRALSITAPQQPARNPEFVEGNPIAVQGARERPASLSPHYSPSSPLYAPSPLPGSSQTPSTSDFFAEFLPRDPLEFAGGAPSATPLPRYSPTRAENAMSESPRPLRLSPVFSDSSYHEPTTPWSSGMPNGWTVGTADRNASSLHYARNNPVRHYRSRYAITPEPRPAPVIDLTGESPEAAPSQNDAQLDGPHNLVEIEDVGGGIEEERGRPLVSGRGAQRLPRYEREIIDLSEEQPEPPRVQQEIIDLSETEQRHREIIGRSQERQAREDRESREREAARRSDGPRNERERRELSARSRERSTHRLPRYDREIIDLSDEDPLLPTAFGDGERPDIEFVFERTLPTPALPPRRIRDDFAGLFPARREPMGPNNRHQAAQADVANIPPARQQITPLINELLRASHFAPLSPLITRFGIEMDFATVGFDMGMEQEQEREPAYPIAIVPPSPAPQGFTRTPKEEEVMVCPNCDDELGVGNTDEKRQVWVVKKCGHVYCGECTKSRSIMSTSRKRDRATYDKEEPTVGPRPFKKCCVAGCEIKTTAKGTMVQLYL
ncbi:hypothetical protein NA57DRAFT_71106 [Rhizodiscina lignyota]|uniref:Uncharacterized protein n=1 Tax=Rhizodiscina lignyota TaxID=1504668 RepID=A0A9P4MC05_9PEZI|nr:hypothetical protein NA57DRAFT_71106 [Rhizodiscina lignyota]